jgi:hypothetical protein
MHFRPQMPPRYPPPTKLTVLHQRPALAIQAVLYADQHVQGGAPLASEVQCEATSISHDDKGGERW